MPLPLPIMIPFMMYQSAAIAAGFGTYFQYSKRRISAMSNEEFNNVDPVALINDDLDTIIAQIPSSFQKVAQTNIAIFDAMNQMLDQAVKYLTQHITGNVNLLTGNPQDPLAKLPEIPGLNAPIIPRAFGEEPAPVPITEPTDQQKTGEPTTSEVTAFQRARATWSSKDMINEQKIYSPDTWQWKTLDFMITEKVRDENKSQQNEDFTEFAKHTPVPTKPSASVLNAPKRRLTNSVTIEINKLIDESHTLFAKFRDKPNQGNWDTYIAKLQKIYDLKHLYRI